MSVRCRELSLNAEGSLEELHLKVTSFAFSHSDRSFFSVRRLYLEYGSMGLEGEPKMDRLEYLRIGYPTDKILSVLLKSAPRLKELV